jgi:hypothetical protein
MKQFKAKQTTRKFYNKWSYKVSLEIKGAGVYRTVPLSEISNYCEKCNENTNRNSIGTRVYHNKEQIVELANFLLNYDPSIWSKRIENSNIDFYTNDSEFYNNISNQFKDQVNLRFEPDTTSNILDQPQVIVGKKLPHNKYQFRVYLLPHKLAGDREEKEKFINWMKTQIPKIRLTDTVIKWFMHTDWNWDRRYILVEDEATLLMLKLRNSLVVGRVYNYVISDK